MYSLFFYIDIADYVFRVETDEIEDGLPLTPDVKQDAKFDSYEVEIEVPLGSNSD